MRILLSFILLICINCCFGQAPSGTGASTTGSSYTELYDFMEDNQRSNAPDSVKQLNIYNKLRSLITEHPKDEMNFSLIYLGKNLSYTQINELAGLIDSSIKHLPSSVWINATMNRISAAETGKPFPHLGLTDTSGTEFLLSGLKGKVVLLDVWSSWCIPCREQIPELRKLYKKYNSRGFEIIGISLDEDKQKWLKAIHTDKQTWKQYCELRNWRANKFASRFHTYAIPANFLIDENGILVGQDLTTETIAIWLSRHY